MNGNRLSFSDNWDTVSSYWQDEIAVEFKSVIIDDLIAREIEIENTNNQIIHDCEEIIRIVKKQRDIFESMHKEKSKIYE